MSVSSAGVLGSVFWSVVLVAVIEVEVGAVFWSVALVGVVEVEVGADVTEDMYPEWDVEVMYVEVILPPGVEGVRVDFSYNIKWPVFIARFLK